MKQLSSQDSTQPIKECVIQEFQKRKLDAEEDGSEPSKLSAKFSTDLILALTDQNPATLIIDALDECEPIRRYELLNALHLIVEESSSVIKILVSSRDDADILSRLIHSSNIPITVSNNGDDIRRFINHELEQVVRDRRLLSGNVSLALQDRLSNKLVDGARGM